MYPPACTHRHPHPIPPHHTGRRQQQRRHGHGGSLRGPDPRGIREARLRAPGHPGARVGEDGVGEAGRGGGGGGEVRGFNWVWDFHGQWHAHTHTFDKNNKQTTADRLVPLHTTPRRTA